MKMHSKKLSFSLSKTWIITWLVMLGIALAIRLPLFGQVPNGLNRDEAALGYNAYSLLKTSRDEHGEFLPVTITSFGDQKLPGYIYTLMPFIQLFELTPVTVRLPSLLSGLVVISMMGVLTLLLSTQFFDKKHAQLASFTVMLLIAISPWGNHFSRTAYEAHLAMACFVSGLLMYSLAFQKEFIPKQRLLLIGAATLWSATLLTYHSYHIFTPLFIVGLMILDWKKIIMADKLGLYSGIAIGAFTVILLFTGGVWSANLQKSGDISPFHTSSLQNQASIFRQYFPGEGVFDKLFANSLTEGVVRLSENLVQVPAGSFLFIHGMDHGDHNPGNIPNFHILIAPFLILGILSLWDWRRKRAAQILLLWLIVAFIPSSLTIRPQHTIRFSPAFPVVELLAALGLVRMFGKLNVKWVRLSFIAVIGYLIIMSVSRFLIQYLLIIPPQTSPNAQFHLLGRAIGQYESQGYQVITQSPTSSPYIWYLFETKYDPDSFVTDVERYPLDQSGFVHVKRVGNVWFESIQWDDLDERAKIEPLILIFKPVEIPEIHRQNSNMQFIDVIQDSYGTVKYEIWKLDRTESP